jgi:hypothetical protein
LEYPGLQLRCYELSTRWRGFALSRTTLVQQGAQPVPIGAAFAESPSRIAIKS